MGVPSISWGGVDVTICLGDETVTQHCRVLDTDAVDIVIGTEFLRRNPQVIMHVGCAHSRLLWPHYRQAVHEAARHLPPGDKALWEASWRSAGATWTEVFCSGLVPEDAEAQLRAIARYDPPGGASVDNFLHHMLRLGDFAWELRNHRLEQLLREPLSAAPGRTNGSPRRRATTPPLPRALTRTS